MGLNSAISHLPKEIGTVDKKCFSITMPGSLSTYTP